MTSVMLFPIHDYPSDYWRFTPQAFQLLLRGFDPSMTGFQGEPAFPHTVIGLGAKAPLSSDKFTEFRDLTGDNRGGYPFS